MEFSGEAVERAKKVKLVIFDVDGVLTDGGIYVGSEGTEVFKSFFCRDGLGITAARKAGLILAIITGRKSPHVAHRAKELHISTVRQGQMDKRKAYRELKEEFSLRDEEVAYIGDDIIDLPIMVQAGFPAAVADAVPEVRERSHMVSGFPGGRGAVREILEFILKSQGLWERVLEGYMDPDSSGGAGYPSPTEGIMQ